MPTFALVTPGPTEWVLILVIVLGLRCFILVRALFLALPALAIATSA